MKINNINLFTYLNAIMKKNNSYEYFDKYFYENDNNFKFFLPYIINRYIYNAGFIDIANEINKYLNILQKREMFKLMYYLVPRYNKFIQYIKKVKTDKLKIIEYIQKLYLLSYEKAEEYLKFLKQGDIEKILTAYAVDDKEKNKIKKEI